MSEILFTYVTTKIKNNARKKQSRSLKNQEQRDTAWETSWDRNIQMNIVTNTTAGRTLNIMIWLSEEEYVYLAELIIMMSEHITICLSLKDDCWTLFVEN